MKLKLKPLADQVIVITGASSGIGLATARMAAKAGARVVAVARSGDALAQLVSEIVTAGGQAIHVIADVSVEDEVRRVAEIAVGRFGGFDTWVNNAGAGIYGRIEQVPIADQRRLMDVNYWSQVHGSLEAVRHFKARNGGALINIGSEVGERGIPLQGAYAATKHAIKGFTEALRMELEDEGAPVSVTLVKPGQIDTPFPVNAKNYLPSEPHHVPPVYAPEVVARAILGAAVRPIRDLYAGGGARGMAAAAHLAPGAIDRPLGAALIPTTPSGREPARSFEDNGLDRPNNRLEEHGNYEGHVMRTSLYTEAKLHPLAAGAAALGVGLALLAGAKLKPHAPARMGGAAGESLAKALHVTLEARQGREDEVRELLRNILAEVQDEPGTRSWYGVRRTGRVFEIFETFPDEAARAAHLAGKGAALLMARSNELLARPARIDRLDLLLRKPG
ncbi:MAG TPA: SDR family oxidoreductase [Sphingomonas sp.]|jgi:short-subunit dehydrogenase/quinol monooxygenase YgiN|uniref:SDR family oxidoreductase n=1 Tax=Sphingomonas sp. TaxID=28214 RepID=UPI002EDB343B